MLQFLREHERTPAVDGLDLTALLVLARAAAPVVDARLQPDPLSTLWYRSVP